MPYRMHSQYLRRLFLDNDLFEGRYQIDGRPIVLRDIHIPIFVVSTERDHVAPWRSVYKINLVSETDVTFLLTSGDHNAGIVSEPGHDGRHYRMLRHAAGAQYVDPETSYAKAASQEGSWWPAWVSWLDDHSHKHAAPPPMGAPDEGYPSLEEAPGRYILER
jgi:poly[(R)-3-hydroxyalkanoate] polymerase subunit PhaC